VCRLHAVLCLLIAGGTGRSLTVVRATKLLAGVAGDDPITLERVATCAQFVAEIAFADQALADTRARTVTAVVASKTSVTDIYGVGPIGAAIIVGHSGDIRRFPTGGHYARHNGTAPLKASSGPKSRHRLNPRGDRQSTMRFTPRRSPRSPTTHPGAPTTNASRPRTGPPRKRCAPSSDASATSSTDSRSTTPATERHRDAPGTALVDTGTTNVRVRRGARGDGD
jgi:hypothetical protein